MVTGLSPIMVLAAVLVVMLGRGHTQQTCQANMHFEDCGSACPKTCAIVTNPENNAKWCIKSCKVGCVCDKGYVLDNAKSKRCVAESECRACQNNTHYQSCGTACPITCENYDNPPAVCTRQCVQGCFCNEGYFFENSTSMRCVPEKECPNRCQANAHYEKCGTACPLNCETIRKPEMCSMQCVPGCYCNANYIFKSGKCGLCVLPSECPQSQESTPPSTLP